MTRHPVRYALVNFAIVIFLMFGGMWFLVAYQRERQIKDAEDLRYVVQAIVDYRATHGWLPESLDDLVPDFLEAVPQEGGLYLSGYLLIIRKSELGHGGGFSYSFSKEDEGWSIPGIPGVNPSVRKLNDDELVSARLKELDRRIVAAPERLESHRMKIGYLVTLGRNDEAIEACKQASKALPHWWMPEYGIALLSRDRDAESAETRFRSWVDAHPAFLNYYYLARYYRQRNRHKDALKALMNAVEYPLADGQPDEHNWVTDAFAFEAAMYSYEQQDHQLTLDITKVWSDYYPPGMRFHSMEYSVFRAAAHLGLGNIAEAKNDAALAAEWSTARFGKPRSIFYAGNLDQLQSAIENGDRTFVYKPGELAESTYSNWDWLWPRFYLDEL